MTAHKALEELSAWRVLSLWAAETSEAFADDPVAVEDNRLYLAQIMADAMMTGQLYAWRIHGEVVPIDFLVWLMNQFTADPSIPLPTYLREWITPVWGDLCRVSGREPPTYGVWKNILIYREWFVDFCNVRGIVQPQFVAEMAERPTLESKC